MSQIIQTLSAGETLRAHSPGDFLRLMTAAADVTVTFYRRGVEVARAEGVRAGYAERIAEGFDAITIYSASAQTVGAMVRLGGEVRYDRFEGNVDINNRQGAYTNSRATVLSSGVSTLLAADANRRYVLVQNNDTSVSLRLTMDGADPTTAQGVRIPPGGYWESPAMYAPTGAIKAIAESGAGVAVEVVKG